MSESNKPDPWALLASDLGVESASPEPSPPSKAPEAATPPVAKAAHHPTEVRKSSEDWQHLAAELGLELPPEVFADAPPASTSAPREPAKPEPRKPEPRKPEPARPERKSEPRRTSWALPEPEVEIVAEVVEEVARTESLDADDSDGIEVAESPLESEERRQRKRRRRRRKSRRPDDTSRLKEPSERPGQQIASAELVECVEFVEEREAEGVVEGVDEAETTPDEAVREEGAPRRKRRRRRRSGRRRESEGAEPVAEADSLEPEALAPAPVEADDLAELEDDDSDEDFDSEEASERRREKLKAIHRGIPSWRDAVDVVISANLEARSKHPERGQYSRPRGGRNRNGRDRSSDR